MNRIIVSALLALCTSLAPHAARAQEDLDEAGAPGGEPPQGALDASTDAATAGSPALGFGYNQSLSGMGGPEVEFHRGALMLAAQLSLSLRDPTEGDSRTGFGVSAAAFYKLKLVPRTALLVGGRLGVAAASAGSTATQFALEVPARAQLWLTDLFAVHLEFGLALTRSGQDGGVFGGLAGDSSRLLLGAGNLLSTAGFTLYLP
jgi:hypothetical protein